MWLEKKGVPTATVVTEPFHKPARVTAASMGFPKLPLVVLPHPVGDLAEADIKDMAEAAYPKILTALSRQKQDTADYVVEYRLPG